MALVIRKDRTWLMQKNVSAKWRMFYRSLMVLVKKGPVGMQFLKWGS